MASEFWTRDVIEGSLRGATRRFLAWYRREFFSTDIYAAVLDGGVESADAFRRYLRQVRNLPI